MNQQHDSEGNPKCVYCGAAMRPRFIRLLPLTEVKVFHIGYADSRLFCTKQCGFFYGLMSARRDLLNGGNERCEQESSGTSRPAVESTPSSETGLTPTNLEVNAP